MPILLQDLIYQLPSDTEDKVKQARDRFNTRVRDALRRETRLSFHRADDTNVTVPVHVVPGLPEPLQPLDQQSIDDKYRVALLLAPYRHSLSSFRDSGRNISKELLPLMAQDPLASLLLNGEEEHLTPAWEYADFLIWKLNEFELTNFILAINNDVLGAYHYKVRGAAYDEPEPRIELYWGVIGLVARDLALPVEDLTCVILAHELAHAYTHVGRDADDHWWSSRSFLNSAHELKEGLAQFYTLHVCKHLHETFSGPLRAFQELLPHQPDAYLKHEHWQESKPEHIRLALLAARRSDNPASIKEFESYLQNAHRQLRKVQRAGGN